MRRVTLLLLMAVAIAAPVWAQGEGKKITVAQLEHMLAADRGKADSEVAAQLAQLELSERASSLRVARWEAEFPGPHAREALMGLADASAFLELPAAEVPVLGPPTFKTQTDTVAKAIEYVSKTLPKLPNFLATRETTEFEEAFERPAYASGSGDELLGGVSALAHAPHLESAGLRVTARFSVGVAYRDGQEVRDESRVAQGGKGKAEKAALTTRGEFGQLLGLVLSDAMHGSIRWAHWEQGAGGPEMVFRYKVAEAKSHYSVSFPFGTGVVRQTPGYHGEMAVDPLTGSVLRLTAVSDLQAPYAQVETAVLVEYGPVEIGGHRYVCPLEGVALSKVPVADAEAGQVDPGTRRMRVNHVAFTQYHVFRSQSRVLAANERDGDETPAAAPVLTAADSGGAVDDVAPKVAAPVEAVVQAPAQVGVSTPAQVSAAAATREADTLPEVAVALPARNGATVLHANANLVLIDVVVTDHDKAVHGLDPKRFHIFENGRERAITSLTEHEPVTSSVAAAAPVEVLPPHTYTNVPAYAEAPSLNVLLLDGLNTPVINQGQVRQQMLDYLAGLPKGTSLAIFTLSGRLQMVQGFTTNVPQLMEALKHFRLGAQPGIRMSNESTSIMSSGADDLAASGELTLPILQAVIRMMQFSADAKVADIDQRVALTMDGMQQLARYLSAIPGRKNLLWFSGSFPLGLGPTDDLPLRAQADPLKDMRSYTTELRKTSELLAAARVAVYPIDARGLMSSPSAGASFNATPRSVVSPSGMGLISAHAHPQADANFARETMLEQSTMTQIAEETGGHAYLDTNGLKEAAARVIENGSSYYTIAYVPSGKMDGDYRHVKVELDHAHYALSYRPGYYADDPDHPSAERPLTAGARDPVLAATFLGAPPSTQILFRARVLGAGDPLLEKVQLDAAPAGALVGTLKGTLRRYVVDVTVDPATVRFEETEDGVRQARLNFALVAYDAQGRRVNYVDRGVRLDLHAEGYKRAMEQGVPLRLAIDVPAGPIALRLAVNDPASGKTGSLEVPVAAK